MKTALILVLSSDWPPYDRLMQVSMETWDSINVEGLETIYYLAGQKQNSDKIIYVDIDKSLQSIGKKTILAFEWALKNKSFDYIARPQANVYMQKNGLLKYIQTLPNTNVYCTIEVKTENPQDKWGWGCGTLWSRDVVQKLVNNQSNLNNAEMEDMALSKLSLRLGVPFTEAVFSSIDNMGTHWRAICYGKGDSFEFKEFSEIPDKAPDHFQFRCKQDADRTKDEYVMRELFKYLK